MVGGGGVGLGNPVPGVGVAVSAFGGDEPAEVVGVALPVALAGAKVGEVGLSFVGGDGLEALVVDDLGVGRVCGEGDDGGVAEDQAVDLIGGPADDGDRARWRLAGDELVGLGDLGDGLAAQIGERAGLVGKKGSEGGDELVGVPAAVLVVSGGAAGSVETRRRRWAERGCGPVTVRCPRPARRSGLELAVQPRGAQHLHVADGLAGEGPGRAAACP
jgi:hypothetical protein